MAINARDYVSMLPLLRAAPAGEIWSSYDAEGDVLYINFKKPSIAEDSELTEDDVIVRFEGDQVIGLTILHASERGE